MSHNSDIACDMRAWTAMKKEMNSKRLHSNTSAIQNAGIPFKSCNNGAMLKFNVAGTIFCYYPSKGFWMRANHKNRTYGDVNFFIGMVRDYAREVQ